MIPRRLLLVLVFALPILTVTFAVVMATYLLLVDSRDATGAEVLRWLGVAILMVAVIDVVLLVGLLGLRAIQDEHSSTNEGTDE